MVGEYYFTRRIKRPNCVIEKKSAHFGHKMKQKNQRKKWLKGYWDEQCFLNQLHIRVALAATYRLFKLACLSRFYFGVSSIEDALLY